MKAIKNGTSVFRYCYNGLKIYKNMGSKCAICSDWGFVLLKMADVKGCFYCVKYPYLILTSAYGLTGANMDDQTRKFFFTNKYSCRHQYVYA